MNCHGIHLVQWYAASIGLLELKTAMLAQLHNSNSVLQTELLSMATDLAGVDPRQCHGQAIEANEDLFAIDKAAARVLVVDDEPINLEVVTAYLGDEGYGNITTFTDSVAALMSLEQQTFDVALLDIMMPRISGLDLLRQMRASKRLRHIPSIVLTASTDRSSKRRAIELGAADFLNKPFDPEELLSRTYNALIRKAHYDRMQNYARDLETQVEQRTAELVASQIQMIHCLGRAAEYRDHESGMHELCVGRCCGVIASQLGMDDAAVRQIELAATLHDIGKLGVSDSILRKNTRLNHDEERST